MTEVAVSETPGSAYVGLISGTSMDGIDAALVRLGDHECEMIATHSHPYPGELRAKLLELSREPASSTVDKLGRLDRWVGECFRDAANTLLDVSDTEASDVAAIGSHGQTIRHLPDDEWPFSLQIGDPNVVAKGTGITTVADFRRRDIASGGQGAPLTPAFHHWLFADDAHDRVVLNLGGIANITVLTADSGTVTGFDTGPASTLMDAWILEHRGKPFDKDGRWARSGSASPELLQRMLGDTYFDREPPKSTGFEHFNLAWLRDKLQGIDASPEDVQATLLALTVESIAAAVRTHAPTANALLVCGGGIHNTELVNALAGALAPIPLESTAARGLDPDWVEACAFAWLASRTLQGLPGNLPSVTGAGAPEVLGAIYQ